MLQATYCQRVLASQERLPTVKGSRDNAARHLLSKSCYKAGDNAETVEGPGDNAAKLPG